MTILRCLWCKEGFVAPHHRGPAPEYCRPSHRQRAYEVRRDDKRYEGLIEFIRNGARAYPPDIFPPPPKGEHGITVEACSAGMARHLFRRLNELLDSVEAKR